MNYFEYINYIYLLIKLNIIIIIVYYVLFTKKCCEDLQ
jgi:hypothetical protein